MNLKEFRKLSIEDQNELIKQIKYKYLDELKNQQTIANELNIVQTAIRKIIEENNIKRTKEQIVAARKKYNLEIYGDENYCNSNKIKDSLKKSNFNFGQNSQEKIAKKLLQEQGLYSWCILNDKQKEYYKNEIIKLLNEVKYDEEICEKLKLTKGCYKRIKKEFNIKRDKNLSQKIMIRRNNDKYGVDNVCQLNLVKDKIKQSNLEHYGVEHSWQREDVKQKSKQTKLERYGNENYRNDEKIKQTCLERYGADNPFSSKIIRNKIYNDNIKKYGSISPFGDKTIIDKSKQTKLERYGCENYVNIKKANETKLKKYGLLQNVEKIHNTCMNKYNVEWPCQLPQCINKSNSISKVNQNFANLLEKNNIFFEQEFVLEDKKFDFKIENILIEINPTYTHNSTIGCGFNGHYNKALDKNYHINKSKLAQENGYFCIHVFDWDDWDKIINLLLPKQKVYARNCKIKEVSKKECDEFLNLYHLQNTCKSQKIRYGLYYNDKLIQLMSFGRPRYNKNYEWELLRLCSHKNYNIVGGSEKLFKHFVRENNPQSIISYCDNAKFSGEVYKRLKFIYKNNTNININWSKGKQKITNNLLMQRGYDQLFGTSYGKGTSNRDLMIQNGWREVYDCGQSIFEYKLIK